MNWVLIVGGLWVIVAARVALIVSRVIRLRDCCPHLESEAPATVRGEFRAVVVRR